MANSFEEHPITGVWEITMGCNMRCRHCGSGCESPLPDELTTEQALKLADDIGQLGMRWITLSGGEPLMRKDWWQIAQRLRKAGVVPNIITNGWYLTPAMIDKAIESGVGVLAVSLDGLEAYHDHMRQPGSFRKVVEGLRLMKEKGQRSGVITTVSRANRADLPGLKRLLTELDLESWQLQIGLPMGNFQTAPELMLDPESVDEVIDFCHDTTLEGGIRVFPADCVGYYHLKELETRRIVYRTEAFPIWDGCNAGRRSLGILHNGDVLGCTSIRDRHFIEGNILQRPLAEIWRDDQAFKWNRHVAKHHLEGNCRICQYGDQCLGGCPNTRLTVEGRLHAGNAYCSYSLRLTRTRKRLMESTQVPELLEVGMGFVRQGAYQVGAMTLDRALELEADHLEGWRYLGFAHFMLNNLPECEAANRRALGLQPGDPYASKGLGLALHRQGRSQEGIELLRKVLAELPADAHEARRDLEHDLTVVLHESRQAA